MEIPMGIPLGNLMGIPMGFPMGFPKGIPMGFPMGISMGISMGFFMGIPMIWFGMLPHKMNIKHLGKPMKTAREYKVTLMKLRSLATLRGATN